MPGQGGVKSLRNTHQNPARRGPSTPRRGPHHHARAQAQPQRREPLSAEAIELTVARLRVLAESNRMALIEALSEREASVQELADRLFSSHQKVSKHLAVLYGAGMVSRRPEGNTVRYALIDWTGWWVIEQIGRWVESGLEEEDAGEAVSGG
jgi:DNA-binding transcriptional ArsR family regulator